MLKRSGQEVPVTKRTLEVNPTHPVIARRREVHAASKDDRSWRQPAAGGADGLAGRVILTADS
jgi:molecular chaperone HtpG